MRWSWRRGKECDGGIVGAGAVDLLSSLRFLVRSHKARYVPRLALWLGFPLVRVQGRYRRVLGREARR